MTILFQKLYFLLNRFLLLLFFLLLLLFLLSSQKLVAISNHLYLDLILILFMNIVFQELLELIDINITIFIELTKNVFEVFQLLLVEYLVSKVVDLFLKLVKVKRTTTQHNSFFIHVLQLAQIMFVAQYFTILLTHILFSNSARLVHVFPIFHLSSHDSWQLIFVLTKCIDLVFVFLLQMVIELFQIMVKISIKLLFH